VFPNFVYTSITGLQQQIAPHNHCCSEPRPLLNCRPLITKPHNQWRAISRYMHKLKLSSDAQRRAQQGDHNCVPISRPGLNPVLLYSDICGEEVLQASHRVQAGGSIQYDGRWLPMTTCSKPKHVTLNQRLNHSGSLWISHTTIN
jgi:hypothetical protein